MNENQISPSLSRLLTLVGLLLFVLGTSGTIEGATIRLKARAEVSGTIIHLGEVAEVYDANPQNVQILNSITLAPAPVPGRTVKVDVELVRSRLKANNVNLLAVEMSGKSSVEVRLAGTVLAGAQVFQNSGQFDQQRRSQQIAERRLKQAIQIHLQSRGYKAGLEEIYISVRPEDREVLLGFQLKGYRIVGGQAPWNQRQQLGVQTQDALGNIHQYLIEMQLKARPDVVMAKYDIPRGQVLQADDLEIRQVNLATGMKNVVHQVDQLVGLEVKQPIRSGTPVNFSQLQTVEAIKRGAMIKVFAQSGGIKVVRFYIAKQSGAIGEEIEVESLENIRGRRKRLHVKIVGVNEAERIIVPVGTASGQSVSR